jgi:hypothetical protein
MIKKFKIFEQTRSEIDPYGEEIWEELFGFEIKKVLKKDGNYKYFAFYHGETNPLTEPGGFIQMHGVMPNDYIMAIGEIFDRGYSFEYFPMPAWDWTPLTDEEWQNILNDKLKINCFESKIIGYEGREPKFGGGWKSLTFSEILKIFKITKEQFLAFKNNEINEYADYRNVTGYGSMGQGDPQNAGPSFNKGPDAATYRRPDVIGLAGDDIEDPYFGQRRKLKMKRIKKNKHIESNRKRKTKYFNEIEKDTLKNKLVENVNVAKGYEKKYKEKLEELEKIKQFLPDAQLEVVATAGGLPMRWEIFCRAKDYLNLGDDKACFASNVFDGLEDLSNAIDDIIENGGNNIEVGGIEIDDFDAEGNPIFLRADTLYFDNIERCRLQPNTPEEIEDYEMEPFWSAPHPNEIDGWPMRDPDKSKGKWYGKHELDPYGEEDWDNEAELWSWRVWWD